MSNKNQLVKPLQKFESNLDTLLEKGIQGIPSDINSDMLKMNAMMSISQNDSLKKHAMEQPSVIAQYVYNFVVMGLDMLQGDCYIIPYKGKLTPVIDYKGQKKIAMQYSVKPIKIIKSGVVRKNDNYQFDDENRFQHRYEPFDTEEERGEVVGAYASIVYEDNSQHDTFVNMQEINKVRDMSPSSKSNFSPWVQWSEQMYEKTAIRKGMKYVNLNFLSPETSQAYKEADQDVEFRNDRKSQQKVEEVEVFEFVDGEYVDTETGEVMNEEVIIDLD